MIDGGASATEGFEDGDTFTGQVFEFTYSGTQFYVSGAKAVSVPDGGISAMLLGFACLSLRGLQRFLKKA